MPREKVIEYPNRKKASSKLAKLLTILLLLVSAGLVLIVTVGGWEALQGAKALQISFIVLYLICAFMIARWRRGLLPVVAALAMVLLIFAAIAGPEWFDRDKRGFEDTSIAPELLALITLLIVPVQVLLIAAAMTGFSQKWQTEVVRDKDERDGYYYDDDDDDRRRRGGAVAAPV